MIEKFKAPSPILKNVRWGRKSSDGTFCPYGSPFFWVSKKKHRGRQVYRVSYRRGGISFERAFQSQRLCAYIARQVFMLADLENFTKVPHVNATDFYQANVRTETGAFLWINDADPETVVQVDREKFFEVDVPWFKVKRKPGFVSPRVRIESKKVSILWTDLMDSLFQFDESDMQELIPPTYNFEGQKIVDWRARNLTLRRR